MLNLHKRCLVLIFAVVRVSNHHQWHVQSMAMWSHLSRVPVSDARMETRRSNRDHQIVVNRDMNFTMLLTSNFFELFFFFFFCGQIRIWSILSQRTQLNPHAETILWPINMQVFFSGSSWCVCYLMFSFETAINNMTILADQNSIIVVSSPFDVE